MDILTDEVIAVGDEAAPMVGRAPERIRVVRPLRDGVISDYRVTEIMLKHFLKKIMGRGALSAPRLVICVPSGVTEVEKQSVRLAVRDAGVRKVRLVEEPVAAAIGAGLDIFQPIGSMVVDVGGGTTDIAVISLGGLVASETLRIAGDEMDEALIGYMKRQYGLLIGEQSAQEMKIKVGSVYPRSQVTRMKVAGKDMTTGLPRLQSVGSDEFIKPLDRLVQAMLTGIAAVLERTPNELKKDIVERGIILTGGGALIYGLDTRIRQHTQIPCVVADDPVGCVVRGAGKMLDMPGTFSHQRFRAYEDAPPMEV
jgi:rod shape-determining protein MreB